jgi:hypothetical protein
VLEGDSLVEVLGVAIRFDFCMPWGGHLSAPFHQNSIVESMNLNLIDSIFISPFDAVKIWHVKNHKGLVGNN